MTEINLLNGFHGPETFGMESFRWTRKTFSLSIDPSGTETGLCLTLGNNFPDDYTALEVESDNGKKERFLLKNGRHDYYIMNLPPNPCIFNFSMTDALLPQFKDFDPRELGVKYFKALLFPKEFSESAAQGFWRAETLKTLCIESTSRCNFNCAMCGHSYDKKKADHDFHTEWIPRVARLARKAENIVLHGFGEPLLTPVFPRLVEAIRDDPPRIIFNTNGSILNPQLINLILSGSIREIFFSVDGATPETYRYIRNHSLEHILANIRTLIKARRNLRRKSPAIAITAVLMRRNLSEAPSIIDLAAELGVELVNFTLFNNIIDRNHPEWVIPRPFHNFQASNQLLIGHLDEVTDILNQCIQNSKRYGIEFRVDQIRTPFVYHPFFNCCSAVKSKPEAKDCPLIWTDMAIRADGKVRLCPFQEWQSSFGSLNDGEDAEDIWNSADWKMVRYQATLNRLPEACNNACRYTGTAAGIKI